MEDALVRVVDLCKVYNPGENEVRALDHVNLEIHKDVYKRQYLYCAISVFL